MSEQANGSGSGKLSYGKLALIIVIVWVFFNSGPSEDLQPEIGALRNEVHALKAAVRDLTDETRAAKRAASNPQTPLGRWQAVDDESTIEFREDGTFTLDAPGGATNGTYTRSWAGQFQLELDRGSEATEELTGQLYTSGNELEIIGPPARGRAVSRYLREGWLLGP